MLLFILTWNSVRPLHVLLKTMKEDIFNSRIWIAFDTHKKIFLSFLHYCIEHIHTSVKYSFGSLDMKECTLAVIAASVISLSVASILPILKLSLIVPEKSNGSWDTEAMFLRRDFRSSLLILWPSMNMSPATVCLITDWNIMTILACKYYIINS